MVASPRLSTWSGLRGARSGSEVTMIQESALRIECVDTTVQEQVRQRLRERTASVAVIGLGYVGLPLAVAFAEAGFPVSGVDVDAGKVASLMQGQSPVGDVSDP